MKRLALRCARLGAWTVIGCVLSGLVSAQEPAVPVQARPYQVIADDSASGGFAAETQSTRDSRAVSEIRRAGESIEPATVEAIDLSAQKDGATLRLTIAAEDEGNCPILSKIPYLNRLFQNANKFQRVICVQIPRAVIRSVESEPAPSVRQVGYGEEEIEKVFTEPIIAPWEPLPPPAPQPLYDPSGAPAPSFVEAIPFPAFSPIQGQAAGASQCAPSACPACPSGLSQGPGVTACCADGRRAEECCAKCPCDDAAASSPVAVSPPPPTACPSPPSGPCAGTCRSTAVNASGGCIGGTCQDAVNAPGGCMGGTCQAASNASGGCIGGGPVWATGTGDCGPCCGPHRGDFTVSVAQPMMALAVENALLKAQHEAQQRIMEMKEAHLRELIEIVQERSALEQQLSSAKEKQEVYESVLELVAENAKLGAIVEMTEERVELLVELAQHRMKSAEAEPSGAVHEMARALRASQRENEELRRAIADLESRMSAITARKPTPESAEATK